MQRIRSVFGFLGAILCLVGCGALVGSDECVPGGDGDLGPLVDLPACLDAGQGVLVSTLSVSAEREDEEVHLPVAPGTYGVVVEGVFEFSEAGRQDGCRRFYDPLLRIDPVCFCCKVAPDGSGFYYENLYSLVFHDEVERLTRECPFAHRYLFLVRPQNGELKFKINDAKWLGDAYDDNKGSLTLAIYRLDSCHPLVARDRPGYRLGHPVGDALPEGYVGTDLASASWPRPGQDFLVEIQGFLSTGQGIEQDATERSDYTLQTQVSMPFLESNCSLELITGDPLAHRYLFRASACQDPAGELVVRLPPAYQGETEAYGKSRLRGRFVIHPFAAPRRRR